VTRPPGTVEPVQPERVECRVGVSTITRECAECRAPIGAGDRFLRVHGAWAGHVRTATLCIACAGILWWSSRKTSRPPGGAAIGGRFLRHADGDDAIQPMLPWDAVPEIRP
jgi:hypothetical protein